MLQIDAIHVSVLQQLKANNHSQYPACVMERE